MAEAKASTVDTVLVGDSAIDLRTAHAAGVRLCLVTYGFGFPLASAELTGDELLAGSAAELVVMLGSPA
jgi:phosphoglycolate phosphatase-like HAD superfamily hydrolase